MAGPEVKAFVRRPSASAGMGKDRGHRPGRGRVGARRHEHRHEADNRFDAAGLEAWAGAPAITGKD